MRTGRPEHERRTAHECRPEQDTELEEDGTRDDRSKGGGRHDRPAGARENDKSADQSRAREEYGMCAGQSRAHRRTTGAEQRGGRHGGVVRGDTIMGDM